MDEKAIVKIGSDGNVLKCAKGLAGGECGYKAGAKVCGKCGAMAVQIKAAEEAGTMMDDETDEDEVSPEELETLTADLEAMLAKVRSAARQRRLDSMGAKSAVLDDEVYVCALERKIHAAADDVCSGCRGGCAPEAGLPTLLEIEGIAEEMFGAKILDSGYADTVDVFVVDLEGKDGRVFESMFNGSTGECIRWQLLDIEPFAVKSAFQTSDAISIDDAKTVALSHVEGKVLNVDAEVINGVDAYVVEIDGADGNSHDVYIDLDGQVLGHAEFTPEEVMEIDADAAEVAMKRLYSDDRRMELAESGEAMSDGSYPIVDQADLRNAIQAFGRAKNPEATKKHIMKRAMALGMEDMIPENWRSAKGMGADDPEKYVGMNDDETPMGKSIEDEFLVSLIEFETLALEAEVNDLLD